VLFQSGLYQEQVKGDLDAAIKVYERIIINFPKNRPVAAKVLLHIGLCKEKLGLNEAINAYQKVVDQYPEQQGEVSIAKERIAELSKALEEVAKKPTFREIRIPNRIHSDAQFSPDGKKIALGFEKKLWIMPRFGKLGPDYPGAPQLLNTGEIEVDWDGFTWSGDGRWIAFSEAPRIYIVSAEGGKPKQVHDSDRHVRIVNHRMSLSPHGKTLAFSSNDEGKLHIYTISVDGGLPKQLTDSTAREPVFSPDGKMIAYVEDKNLGIGGGGLWTVPADGGTPTLVAKAGNASSPVWSPDGRMIAFLDYAVGNQIYIVPIGEDGKPTGEKVTIDCPEGIKLVKRLAGWTPDNEIGAIFQKQKEFALYTQPVQGGKVTFVTHGGYPLQPRWSPDGRQIYHTNKVDEARGDWQGLAIAHVSAEGGDVTTVPIQSESKIVIWGYGAGNHVSPDGNTIVFAGRKSQEGIGIKHIWTLPIEGGKPKQLTDDPQDWYPCWSPDGKVIAFLRGPTSEHLVSNIYIIPADGGEPRQLTSESDMVFGARYGASSIAFSPDGELLAYFSRDEKTAPDGTLKVIPVDGGEPRVVGKVKSIYANKEMAWSPDSKQIAFNEGNVIKIVSIEDGNIVDIEPDLEDTGIYHLDWSPNGERLVFAGNKGGELQFWLVENFLPEATTGE
jgi:Tol biopolymer transport system component